jgi:hypothetical protein
VRRIGLVVAVLAVCVGCARHYRVTDPHSGRVYYTEDVDKLDSGAAEFTDAKSGADVTLQSSQVERITEEAFLKEVGPK